MPNSDDIGSYIMTKTNSTKTCGAWIDDACAAALGNDKCIVSKIDAMLAAEGSAPPGNPGGQNGPGGDSGGGGGGGGGGLSKGGTAGVVVGCVVGGLAVIAAVVGLLVVRSQERRTASTYAAGKLGPGQDLESGAAAGGTQAAAPGLKGGAHGQKQNGSPASSSSDVSSGPLAHAGAGPHGRSAVIAAANANICSNGGYRDLGDSFGFSSGRNFAAQLGTQKSGAHLGAWCHLFAVYVFMSGWRLGVLVGWGVARGLQWDGWTMCAALQW